MKLFIDTEFTSLRAPDLLSIGLVSDDERERYVEFAAEHMAGKVFVRRTVLTQWAIMPGRAASVQVLGHTFGVWLLSLVRSALEVIYDVHADFELLFSMRWVWGESGRRYAK
jgi:hypothetical protein